VNAEHAGFVVDLAELEALAGQADGLSETIRTAWQKDWFEDDKWPGSDPLREAVIAYRRSLQAAMERLSTGGDRVAGHLRATAEQYHEVDGRAAREFERIARGE
jgi:uncharacterized protein YukE